MPHVTVIIRHDCRLYHVTMFIAIIAFYGWIVNVVRRHVCLVPPHHSCQITPGPMSPCFNISVLGLRSLCMPFLCSLTVPQQEIRHISLVNSHHSCQVTPGPYSNVTMFQHQCLRFEVLGHALSV